MNIQDAKEEIRNTLQAYLQKDEWGAYCYPVVRQRPLLLMGPPGVGKTAIVQQVARECGLPLVCYTMTHHTRQSAVGLPVIQKRTYCGREFSITEYTMSEIIGTVYRAMEQTGKKEGILFLDEINCVSETLAPTMLQFLQNKTFGNHTLPEGWVIIAAGNPPEYNKSVREFDIVTLDRIRNIQVEAQCAGFLEYGTGQGLHGAVLSYLKNKPERFYHVCRRENSVSYVTARGWEDLSRLLQSYETLDIPVTEAVIGEFLRLEETCRDFYAYYRLYAKYGREYAIEELLTGQAESSVYADRVKLAAAGDFAERFLVTNLVLEQLGREGRAYEKEDSQAVAVHELLKSFLHGSDTLEEFLSARKNALETKSRFQLLGGKELLQEKNTLRLLEIWQQSGREARCREKAQWDSFLEQRFQELLEARRCQVQRTGRALSGAFGFISDCFGDGQELLLLLTGITANPVLMDYIARHGCREYVACSRKLMCQQQEDELRKKCLEAMKAEKS